MRRLSRTLVLATSLAIGLGSLTAQAAEPSPPIASAPESFTLLTGDKVSGTGRVEPAEGREHIPFVTRHVDNHVYVFPSDVLPLVADGTLDRRLFDITLLRELQYGDAHSNRLPVIVTYAGTRALATGKAKLAAARVQRRDLPAVNGTAVQVPKANPDAFWNTLGSASARSVSKDVERIWLDGALRPTLDESVPQIGAPAAWNAGLTAEGITVAVVDTGIDAAHPDLAGQVVDAANFTAETGDRLGHGTHVASIIASTGAAANRWKGVAPGADLLDAKVCSRSLCQESAIIAGMQWAAVDKRAKVINVSLGGNDSPGVDPMEEAVNNLTAQTGALFVIAAGNDGPSRTVNTPGSADAALTVGSVNKQDGLAPDSSTGPRIDDSALKPDLTAPGVGIVAARAAGTRLGQVVDEQHVRVSGTSMATPHVAGAAAILAQQHPDWTAERLKAALQTAAKPIAGQSVYVQGAGRVDVAKAITQPLISEPGTLSYGLQRWPHSANEPITKQLTYRNLGTQPVTLALSTTLTGPGGTPAPADALTLGSTSVNVPAGGTATVPVTLDSRRLRDIGLYAGAVTATGAGQPVRTPVGLEMEEEKYDLTIRLLDRTGSVATDFYGWLGGVDSTYRLDLRNATTQVRLPKGRYVLDAAITTATAGGEDVAYVVQPHIDLTQNTTIVADARLAQPVEITLPRANAELAAGQIGYLRSDGGSGGFGSSLRVTDLGRLYTAHLGPELPASEMKTIVDGQWAQASGRSEPGLEFLNTPYVYGLMWKVEGGFITGFRRDVQDSDLATVTSPLHSSASGTQAIWDLTGVLDGRHSSLGVYVFDLPSTVTLHLSGGDVTWGHQVTEVLPPTDPSQPPTIVSLLTGKLENPQVGGQSTEPWNSAVLGPEFPDYLRWPDFEPDPVPWLNRTDDRLSFQLPLFSDRGGHVGMTNLRGATDGIAKVYRNGELIQECQCPGYIDAIVGPETATYRVETSATRPQAAYSTSVSAAWTFRSGHADGVVALPLSTIQFAPTVGPDNRRAWSQSYVMPVTVQGQPGSAAAEVETLEVEVSIDDGTTWHDANPVKYGPNRWLTFVQTPQGGTHVSIRAKAVDAAGNTVEQTIMRAYGLR